MTAVCSYAFPPVFVPQVRDELLVAFTQRRLLVCSDQSAAVDEELSERRTEPRRTGERWTMRSDVMEGHPEPVGFFIDNELLVYRNKTKIVLCLRYIGYNLMFVPLLLPELQLSYSRVKNISLSGVTQCHGGGSHQLDSACRAAFM